MQQDFDSNWEVLFGRDEQIPSLLFLAALCRWVAPDSQPRLFEIFGPVFDQPMLFKAEARQLSIAVQGSIRNGHRGFLTPVSRKSKAKGPIEVDRICFDLLRAGSGKTENFFAGLPGFEANGRSFTFGHLALPGWRMVRPGGSPGPLMTIFGSNDQLFLQDRSDKVGQRLGLRLKPGRAALLDCETLVGLGAAGRHLFAVDRLEPWPLLSKKRKIVEHFTADLFHHRELYSQRKVELDTLDISRDRIRSTHREAPVIRLRFLEGPLADKFFEIKAVESGADRFEITIGRSPKCDIQINDTSLNDVQAIICFDSESGWYLLGTPLNSQACLPIIFLKNKTQFENQKPSFFFEVKDSAEICDQNSVPFGTIEKVKQHIPLEENI